VTSKPGKTAGKKGKRSNSLLVESKTTITMDGSKSRKGKSILAESQPIRERTEAKSEVTKEVCLTQGGDGVRPA